MLNDLHDLTLGVTRASDNFLSWFQILDAACPNYELFSEVFLSYRHRETKDQLLQLYGARLRPWSSHDEIAVECAKRLDVGNFEF